MASARALSHVFSSVASKRMGGVQKAHAVTRCVLQCAWVLACIWCCATLREALAGVVGSRGSCYVCKTVGEKSNTQGGRGCACMKLSFFFSSNCVCYDLKVEEESASGYLCGGCLFFVRDQSGFRAQQPPLDRSCPAFCCLCRQELLVP